MQTSDEAKQHMTMKQTASTATPREPIGATPKTGITRGVVLGIVLLIFIAGVEYLVFGGNHDAAAATEAEASLAVLAAERVDVGDGRRNREASIQSQEPTSYFPAGYPNRGRNGDGNVMTYEHD